MVPLSNSNFYYIEIKFFLIFHYEMKFPYVIKMNQLHFFLYTRYTCHNRWSKYKYLPWNTLYGDPIGMYTLTSNWTHKTIKMILGNLIEIVGHPWWTAVRGNLNRMAFPLRYVFIDTYINSWLQQILTCTMGHHTLRPWFCSLASHSQHVYSISPLGKYKS